MSENDVTNFNQQSENDCAEDNNIYYYNSELEQQPSTDQSTSNNENVLNRTITKPKTKGHKQPQIYLFNLKNIESVENLNKNIDNLILNNDGFGTLNGNIIIKKLERSSSPTNELCDHCDHKHRQLCCLYNNDEIDDCIQYSNFIQDLDNNNKNYITIFSDEEEEWLTGNISPSHYPKYINSDPQFLASKIKEKEMEQKEFDIKVWIDNYTKFLNIRQQQQEEVLKQQREILDEQRLMQQLEREHILEQRRLQQKQRELLHQKQQELLEQQYLQPIQNTEFVAMINGHGKLTNSLQLQHLYQTQQIQERQLQAEHEKQRKIRQEEMEHQQREYDCYYHKMRHFFDSLQDQRPYVEPHQLVHKQKVGLFGKEKQNSNIEKQFQKEQKNGDNYQQNNKKSEINSNKLEESKSPNFHKEQNKPLLNQGNTHDINQKLNQLVASTKKLNVSEPPQTDRKKFTLRQLFRQYNSKVHLKKDKDQTQVLQDSEQKPAPQKSSQTNNKKFNKSHQPKSNNPTQQHMQSKQNQTTYQRDPQHLNSQQDYKNYHNQPNYNQQNIQEELARIHNFIQQRKLETNVVNQQYDQNETVQAIKKE